MRDASWHAGKLLTKDLRWASFIIQGAWGAGKDSLFLSGSSSSSLISLKVCIQVGRRVVLKLLPWV